MQKIDLRSDTVTHPSPQMRQAILNAEVGDDVFGEDPSANRLEELAAQISGKEAALFVASGTMGNIVSILARCNRGDEAIVGSLSHILIHEQGAVSALGGVATRVVKTENDGTMDIASIESVINEDDIHCTRSKVICIENTWYGRVLPLTYMQEVKELAEQNNLAVHLDGARLFNAAIALKVPAAAIAQYADSVQFCLSKGLAAPVGSIVCGDKDFIARARRVRKQLGGGMRQVGMVAAAGIVALKSMVERLQEDHEHAVLLAELLGKIAGIKILHQETNMLFIASAIPAVSSRQLSAALNDAGLLQFGDHQGIRLVTHYGIEKVDIEKAAEIAEQVCLKLQKQSLASKA
ncbi:MAG: low-specificity L-threonine aldolase [Candidatus Obscuribacterales bacterium]|nr:low-specificity L-threonine aldolase [Candidatus Obscuribacterales bacterium]